MKTILLILFLLATSIYSNDCKLMEVTFKRVDRINGRNVTYVYKDTTQIKEWVKYKDKYYITTCSSTNMVCDYIREIKKKKK